tara:strand:- start:1425 stop:2297 length:873 start_codon:yes stop_codon:yes gene_type:complete
MAVPSSGTLSLLGIWSEKNENDYTAMNADGENMFSLRGLSDDGEDDSLTMGQINLNSHSPSKPDQSTPHRMSEFYGYNHDQAAPNTTFSNTIADFTLTVNINQTGVSPLKTFTINNPSGDLTHQFSNHNNYGTIYISMSTSGDPGSGGTSNSATGWVAQGFTATKAGTFWSASHTIYVRYKLAAHSGAAGDDCTSTFTNNTVSDAVEVDKVSHNPGRSDMRFKTNIERIGYSDMNIPIYLFNYKEDLNTTYKGVMAQDLLKLGFNDSVSVGRDGYYRVDYNKIDVNMEKI